MPHPVTCGACNAAFSIPDDVWEKRVQGQVATLKCRHCKSAMMVDGRIRKGSSVVSSEGNLSNAKSQVKGQTQTSPPSNVGQTTARDERKMAKTDVSEPRRFVAESKGQPATSHLSSIPSDWDLSQPTSANTAANLPQEATVTKKVLNPELKPLSKRANTARSSVEDKDGLGLASDNSDDETVVYRPDTKEVSVASTGASRIGAPTNTRALGDSSPRRLNRVGGPISSEKQDSNATVRNGGSDVSTQLGASGAKSALSMGRGDDTARGGQDVAQIAKDGAEITRNSPMVPATARTVVSGARAGGPPPLRKVQPAAFDEQAHSLPPEVVRPVKGPDGGAPEGVGKQSATHGPKSPVKGPPPLPVQASAPQAAPAESRYAAEGWDLSPRDHSPASLPVVTAVAIPGAIPGTMSFANNPSDIAALVKMHPKFPKWLPFVVLGGIVLLAIAFAVLSWFRPDNTGDSAKTLASNDMRVLPSQSSFTPSANKVSTAVSAPEPVKSPENRDSSFGFANQFAQAAAKQRPTARFDRDLAEKTLASAFAKAASCHNRGDPTGTAVVTVSISPSGQILSVTVAPPFGTTFTAECIRNALADARSAPFQGAPGRLAHSISVK